jgi:hypothetical protein
MRVTEKSWVTAWPALTTVTAALAPAVTAQRARRPLRGRWTFRGVRGVPAWGAGDSREGGGRGSRAGQSRDSSPIVPQHEQKNTMRARQSPSEWPGTPHLQHKDSGRRSRAAWGPRPCGLSSTHSSCSTPSQTSSGVSLASIWSGAVVWAWAVSSAALRLLAVVPRGSSWGLLGSVLSTPARATSISSTTVHSSPAGGPWCGLCCATEVPADRRV